jgi:type II secretory pathway component GspD/PulD (secretin)/tetratricopeptide (TPR) repeat protein
MKTTPQSVRDRDSRIGCDWLGNQHKVRKLTKVSVFRASFTRRFCSGSLVGCNSLILADDTPATTIIVNTFRTKCLGVRCVLALFLGLAAVCASSFAQTPDNVAEREVQRRQAGISQGEAALARGKAAMKAKDYGAAHEEFRTAVTYLPDAVVSGKAHDEAVEGFCKSGVVLAEARIAEGRYADAEAILSEVLSDRYDSKCRPAQELYAHLRQPGYFNKTMSPTFIEKVEQVKQLLAEADGFYNSGRYDLAMKRYDQVLALDPYNTAARRGQEKVNNTKYKYGVEAYDETRSRQLWQVEKAWEQPVRRYGQTGEPAAIGAQRNLGGTARISNKLTTIIIPRLEFRDASLREAVDFLREQAVENDPATEGKRGVNIVIPPSLAVQRAVTPPAAGSPAPAGAGAPAGAPAAAPAGTPVPGAPPAAAANRPGNLPAAPPPERGNITIELNHIPLGEALRYIANQAGLKVKVEPYAVSLVPKTEQSDDLLVKRYHVPPEFFGGPLDVGYYLEGSLGAGQTGAGGSAQPAPVAENVVQKEAVSYQSASGVGTGAGATSQSNLVQGTSTTRQHLLNDRQLVGRADARTMLQSMGVQFPTVTLPDGRGDTASATFWPHTGVLIVRNTQDNLDMVDALVDQANASQPKQVEIESKFIEVTQNNLKELGFDWLLGPFKVGNQGAFGSGGTSVNSAAANPANFPFVDPATQQPIGQFPVTGGNRSGSLAISANALDALLFPGASGVAPGIFGLAGVFTNPQFQVVIRALNQKKGIDLLSAPKVTTKSGQRAIIEVVREFRYPKTYTQPQVPQIGSTTGGNNNVVPVVVTPTTPQDWETRNTGVTLEVEPVVGEDATTIDLNLVPQVVEFEGFINYGSPINAVGVNTVGGVISTSVPVLLTENVINQPVFSTRKVTTSVSVYDGQTVVLGGLMREDVQKTEDKTPIIGDIPLVGRLFRTNVDQHIKRNLVIFVTARVITPSGLAFNNEEEEEEGLLPPALPEAPAYKK